MQKIIFVQLLSELKNKYAEKTLIRIIKLLYGFTELGIY